MQYSPPLPREKEILQEIDKNAVNNQEIGDLAQNNLC